MKELSIFIDESGDFGEYDERSPYYIISMVFHDQGISIFEAVLPKEYKLFQIADLICTTELTRLKIEHNHYSVSEELFFGKQYDFKRNYLRIVQRKEWK